MCSIRLRDAARQHDHKVALESRLADRAMHPRALSAARTPRRPWAANLFACQSLSAGRLSRSPSATAPTARIDAPVDRRIICAPLGRRHVGRTATYGWRCRAN
jgi:hypothetical protein